MWWIDWVAAGAITFACLITMLTCGTMVRRLTLIFEASEVRNRQIFDALHEDNGKLAHGVFTAMEGAGLGTYEVEGDTHDFHIGGKA